MREELRYARGDMPGAIRFEVYNGETGARLFNIYEANADEGWYDQIVTVGGVRVADKKTGRWAMKRIHAPVKIYRQVDPLDCTEDRQRKAEAKRARQAARQAKSMAA